LTNFGKICQIHSTIFHETDVIEFQDSYECRRINVTLLYATARKPVEPSLAEGHAKLWKSPLGVNQKIQRFPA
jgi:hypothetical protein